MSQMTCGLAYVTGLPLSEVEDWIEANCSGDWSVGLADGDDPIGGGKTKIQVLFELREDLEIFKGRFKAFEQQKVSAPDTQRGEGGEEPKKKGSVGMLRPDQD
ncbi:MAG: hypothetical protein HN403_18280 [Rhodospirillales bacterium]|nr:hypothetical protein [Rhodospirillales bacterium]